MPKRSMRATSWSSFHSSPTKCANFFKSMAGTKAGSAPLTSLFTRMNKLISSSPMNDSAVRLDCSLQHLTYDCSTGRPSDCSRLFARLTHTSTLVSTFTMQMRNPCRATVFKRSMNLRATSLLRRVASKIKQRLVWQHLIAISSLINPASTCVALTVSGNFGKCLSASHSGKSSRFLSMSMWTTRVSSKRSLVRMNRITQPLPEPGPPARNMAHGRFTGRTFLALVSTFFACRNLSEPVYTFCFVTWSRYISSNRAASSSNHFSTRSRPSDMRTWLRNPNHPLGMASFTTMAII
mmetsp:Transcript_1226/g.3583  ORF Transcript_1226/g.3583 Transcript_1226/m.3583 type:complete len:294 (+) Transcript_1226:947-1828(+)